MRKCNSSTISSCAQPDVFSAGRGKNYLNSDFCWPPETYPGDYRALCSISISKEPLSLRSLLLEKSHLLLTVVIHLKVNCTFNIFLLQTYQKMIVIKILLRI